jgi:hypothetical protein
MSIKVNLTDGASPALRAAIALLTGTEAAELNAVGARAAVEHAVDYHRTYNIAMGWINPALPTHGPGRESTGFGDRVANSWHFQDASSTGATISNDAPHLGHKVRGGKITPKRVNFLTIPVVPEAHGRTAADYVRDFRRKLFTIKGRNALFEQTTEVGSETVLARTYGKHRNGQRVQLSARAHIRAVYILSRGVDQDPWPGALPDTKGLADAYSNAWRNEFADRIDKL